MRGFWRSDARVRRRAAHWVALVMSGTFDREAFEQWAARDSRHRLMFERLWGLTSGQAVTDALQRAPRSVPSPRLAVPERRPLVWGSGAAAALAAVTAVAMLWPSGDTHTVFHTPAGVTQRVTLADGTHLTLAADTLLRVDLDGRRRLVTLERGEAFFDVSHDVDRPFIVQADFGRAEVLGTRFALDVIDDQIELLVHEGRVRFGRGADEGSDIIATRGRRVVLSRGGGLQASSFDPDAADWRGGWLEVEDAPLRRVVAELSRWSKRPITLVDADLGDLSVSGRFRLTEPDQQLSNLALIHDLTVERGPQRILIRKTSRS